MPSPGEQDDSTPAPKAGLAFMIAIVVLMVIVAVYANVQKARRDRIEKVTITPVAATPAVAPSPQP
jgi:hypothetical protein